MGKLDMSVCLRVYFFSENSALEVQITSNRFCQNTANHKKNLITLQNVNTSLRSINFF